ncbi:MAG: cation-translocating P-type ATPase [Oscillospiraceae bacterium]|jgi:Ca2+-transporting ATPase|nr:cation-translocating P-type ATPase [Oscillospiraceae bacterium]
MIAHQAAFKAVETALVTDACAGLTAQQAAERLAQRGPNRLQEKPKTPLILRFLGQLADPMIIILLLAAGISFFVAVHEGNPSEFFEPALILAIVAVNAVMGVAQESKAEKALEALKSMSAPHARVIRDGAERVIGSADVVPGDVVLIEAGDFVPADGRLVQSASLQCEESALTGESLPSEKDAQAAVPESAPLGDRRNMVYAGCAVSYGRGRYLVTATGMGTEMGRIAGMLNQEADGKTPLQQRLAGLSKTLGLGAIVVCVGIFALGYFAFGLDILATFMVAVGLAVSAIPEGLPAIITIVLAIGVQRMVKKNAIIRRLPAVETLGSASVICSDKTGTLTQNRMTLVRAFDAATGQREDISAGNGEAVRRLLRYATLCTDGNVVEEQGALRHIGDPTETSIVLAARANGILKEEALAQCPRLAEVPFESNRKLMSVICDAGGKKLVITKGALDSIAPRCAAGDLDAGAREAEAMGSKALRVLAVAYKEIEVLPAQVTSGTVECGLTFMGLVGMIDPPRPEVREAVALCRQAGIRPVMITGDHVATASAIADDLGIRRDGDLAITGAQLSAMDEETLAGQVERISVYARVSPEDKIRIVKAWQRKHQVVAMTGDGVNDAPALKAADIGCAMGITGTDVAKGAADMTLTDDRFTTIVDAVREGRAIYDNIRKAVAFLLGTNIGEVLVVLTAMLIWHDAPLLSMQLLWINLVTDSLPAIALGREAAETGVMHRPPRPKAEGLFAHGLGVQVALQGALFAALTLAGFAIGRAHGGMGAGRTMAFLVLAMTQVFHAFNMRGAASLFKAGFFTNPHMNRAAGVSLLLIALVAGIPPLAAAFGLIGLSAPLYLAALGLSLVPVVVMEGYKYLTARRAV